MSRHASEYVLLSLLGFSLSSTSTMLSDTISIQLPLKYPETYCITITPEFPGPWTIEILPLLSTNLESNKNDKTTCPVLSSGIFNALPLITMCWYCRVSTRCPEKERE
ncbi:hypothetical protein J3A83DRAFT_4261626 [Scleroderma citrinum]